MKTRKAAQIVARVPEKLKAELEKRAKKRNITAAEMLRIILTNALSQTT